MSQVLYFSKLNYKTLSYPNYNDFIFTNYIVLSSFWLHAIDMVPVQIHYLGVPSMLLFQFEFDSYYYFVSVLMLHLIVVMRLQKMVNCPFIVTLPKRGMYVVLSFQTCSQYPFMRPIPYMVPLNDKFERVPYMAVWLHIEQLLQSGTCHRYGTWSIYGSGTLSCQVVPYGTGTINWVPWLF